MKTINDSVGDAAGALSATGGVATAANAATDGGVLPFLNDNAGAIGVIFTGATFFIFLASKLLGAYIEVREHRRKMAELQPVAARAQQVQPER